MDEAAVESGTDVHRFDVDLREMEGSRMGPHVGVLVRCRLICHSPSRRRVVYAATSGILPRCHVSHRVGINMDFGHDLRPRVGSDDWQLGAGALEWSMHP